MVGSRQNDDKQKAVALFALAENFGKPLPELLLPMWLDLLEEYTVQQVKAGVKHVICEYEYKTLPPFAVLRKAIDWVSGIIPQSEALEAAALAEWAKLMDDLPRYGRNRQPTFCATTAYVLRLMGGWSGACGWVESELVWRKKDFLDHWRIAHGKEQHMELGASTVLALSRGDAKGLVDGVLISLVHRQRAISAEGGLQ